MKWYGIVTIVFIFFALGGILYAGANTDKLGFNFGEPSYISKEKLNLTEDIQPEEKKMTYNECRSDYISKYCLFYSDGDYMKGECLKRVAKSAEKVCEDYR